MPSVRGLRNELLCVHHNLEHFHSGEDGQDASLRAYQEQIRQLDSDHFVAVVAAEASGDVAGSIVLVDLRLKTDDDEDSPESVWFFFALWTVRQDYQGTTLARRLLTLMYNIRQRRYARYPYVGDLAEPGDNEHLKSVLSQLGFSPLPGREFFWFRPRDWTPGSS